MQDAEGSQEISLARQASRAQIHCFYEDLDLVQQTSREYQGNIKESADATPRSMIPWISGRRFDLLGKED